MLCEVPTSRCQVKILNLGCGVNKIDGCVNVDKLPDAKADVEADILELSKHFENESVDTIYLFHVIEHIPDRKHHTLISQIWDVLKPGGRFIVSYPEFKTIAQYYAENKWGMRDFWRMALYGRQDHEWDYHVALMDTPFFKTYLEEEGFVDFEVGCEYAETYNTVIKCAKGQRYLNKEQLYKKTLFA